MNVVLIGGESAGIQMLEALKRSEHCVVAVMASSSKSGASLWNAAAKCHLDTWPATLVKDPALAARLRAASVDIILNVHSLHIIHKDVLRAAKVGAFNLHPGPLPRYAGRNAVSWAIYNGERQHGVTVHKMVPEIDAGPIVYQTLLSIDEEDTALSLSAKCAREGIALMLRLLETASRDPNAVPLADQHPSRREYFGADIPRDGWISWSGSATEIVNFVRACDYFPFRSPWGHPRTTLGNQEIAIVKAFRTRISCTAPAGSVEDLVEGGALVASADECILVTKLRMGQHVHKAGEILKIGDRLGN